MKKEYRDIVNQIEVKWVENWEKTNPAFCDLDTKNTKKFYSLGMFVYPSGEGLHAGHPKNYFPLDAITRFKKMNGFEVLNPMGFDAFGLPAEQHARKTGEPPERTIAKCIANFKNQFKRLGMFYDWTKEVITSDPNFFRTTQWCFIRLFETGYAQRTKEDVNWCPNLGTVLANEETKLVDGQLVSDIGEFPVVKKEEEQWTMNMRLDANDLISNLDNPNLIDWPSEVIKEQKNWIGKVDLTKQHINLKKSGDVEIYIARNNVTKEKSLFLFISHNIISLSVEKIERKERKVINKDGTLVSLNFMTYTDTSLDGAKITVFVLDRDFIIGDVESLLISSEIEEDILNLLLGGKEFDHLYPIFQRSVNGGIKGEVEHSIYRLRNWIFSRQRFWGEPIPIYYDSNNLPHSIQLEDLPLLPPKVKSFIPKKGKLTVLETQEKWLNVTVGDKQFTREHFTMPQWAGSSWYHLAYLLRDGDNYLDITSKEAKKRFDSWLPVDLYIGGKEHAVLHLIYARFWHHVLSNSYGRTPLLKSLTKHKEPFHKLINHGMVNDKYGKKMSKSKGNGINPLTIVDQFGSDAYRAYLLFAGPVHDAMKLDVKGIESMSSWLSRVWRISQNVTDEKIGRKQASNYNQFIKRSTTAIEELKLNVAISFMMEFINSCYKINDGKVDKEHLLGFLKVLHCFAPFISQEIYSFHCKGNITDSTWPKYDEEKIIKATLKYPVQVNGKVRTVIESSKELTEKEALEKALSDERVQRFTNDKIIVKKIFIKSKIISLVVK